jgi:hypothetical protein
MGQLTLETADVSCPFNDGDLETKTDTQEWDFLFSGPLGSRDHTLCTPQSETTRNDDTPMPSARVATGSLCHSLGGTKSPPGIVVPNRIGGRHLCLEVRRIYPLSHELRPCLNTRMTYLEIQLLTTSHRSVLESFDHTHVGVL